MTRALINIDTAEIMGVAEGKGDRRARAPHMTGGGGNWHGWGGRPCRLWQQRLPADHLGEAVNSAVKQTERELIADNTKLEARTVTVEGLVAAVDGGQVVLNVGGKAGLKVGDQLTSSA